MRLCSSRYLMWRSCRIISMSRCPNFMIFSKLSHNSRKSIARSLQSASMIWLVVLNPSFSAKMDFSTVSPALEISVKSLVSMGLWFVAYGSFLWFVACQQSSCWSLVSCPNLVGVWFLWRRSRCSRSSACALVPHWLVSWWWTIFLI